MLDIKLVNNVGIIIMLVNNVGQYNVGHKVG